MNANIEITTDSNGCATKLLLNGTDISNMVSAVTFRQVGGAMPTVELTFVADCVSIKDPRVRAVSTRTAGRCDEKGEGRPAISKSSPEV